jgi:hypothetical protein
MFIKFSSIYGSNAPACFVNNAVYVSFNKLLICVFSLTFNGKLYFMKKYYLLFVLIFTFLGEAKGQGPSIYNLITASVDADKNVNLIGYFQDSMIFNNAVVHSSMSPDIAPEIFLAHLDSNSNMRWCKLLRGSAYDGNAFDMDVVNDKAGNIYIGGVFYGTIFLDAVASIVSSDIWPIYSLFVAKYDTSGNLLWYRQSMGNITASKFSLGIDSQGSTYFSAVAYDWVSFSADTLFLTDTSSFVTKFDSAGNHLWFSQMRGSKEVYDFQTDPAGNSFNVGICSDTQFCDTSSYYFPGSNSYIAKFSPSGQPEWQRPILGGPFNIGWSVGVGPNGKPSIAGYFKDSLYFSGLPVMYAPTTAYNMFLGNYDHAGNPIWAIKSTPCIGFGSSAHQTRVDGLNNIFCVGSAADTTLSVDTATFSFPITTSGEPTRYVIKFDSLHQPLCSVSLRGVKMPSISLDNENNFYLVGKRLGYISNMAINADIITYPHPTPSATIGAFGNDIFIAKFDQSCVLKHLGIVISIGLPLESVPQVESHLIKAYPNPTTDELYISEVPEGGSYRLVNIAGATQMQGRLSKGENVISTHQLPTGMYLLQMITGSDEKKQVVRIMKQ